MISYTVLTAVFSILLLLTFKIEVAKPLLLKYYAIVVIIIAGGIGESKVYILLFEEVLSP